MELRRQNRGGFLRVSDFSPPAPESELNLDLSVS